MNRSIPNLARVALALTILLAAAVPFASAQQKSGETREVLSKHQTVAQFVGISEHKCMGRTSLCPDKCGNSGQMATFCIVKYLAYEKLGRCGDKKQKKYQFLVEDNMKNLKVPANIKAAVDALKPGDYVLLDWQQDCVTKDGSKYSERNITLLKPISREEAEKLAGKLDPSAEQKP